jgi:hypothetical protein
MEELIRRQPPEAQAIIRVLLGEIQELEERLNKAVTATSATWVVGMAQGRILSPFGKATRSGGPLREEARGSACAKHAPTRRQDPPATSHPLAVTAFLFRKGEVDPFV